jgi:hypothetical protein
MKPSKPIKDWRNIFLDTSVIVDYLQNPERHSKNPVVQKRIINTQALIRSVTELDKENNTKCFLYVSAVTLAELMKTNRPDNIAQEVAQIFNTADVVFVDFSRSIANWLQRSLESYLPDNHKYEFIRSLEKALSENHVMNARQWVSDDLKIAASAGSVKRLDVILTADRRTFYPIAEKLELPCMVTDDIPLNLFGEIDIEIV